MKKIMTTVVIALTSCAALAQQRQSVFYVSENGSDQADGTSAATAFRTLERGRNAARASGAGASVLIAGRFLRTSPLQLTAADKGLTLAAAAGKTVALSASQGARSAIAIDGADGVQLRNLHISGFAADGILARNAVDLRIVRNTVTNTRSTSWSQGAIHLTGSVRGAVLEGNVVKGADYAGIIVDTAASSDVSNVQIKDNTVTDTCRRVADCGAIYVNDRGRRSTGIVIANNVVNGFGPPSASGRAIYLDDWASGVSVRNNSISGPGRYAFQIHGGRGNRLDGNSVNLRAIDSALLVEPAKGGQWKDLIGNILTNNRFDLAEPGRPPALSKKAIPSAAYPLLTGNRSCIKGVCSPYAMRPVASNSLPD
jgi:hypothetical protein